MLNLTVKLTLVILSVPERCCANVNGSRFWNRDLAPLIGTMPHTSHKLIQVSFWFTNVLPNP